MVITTNVFANIGFIILALIVFILVLGVIILIHEGGHFFFAKRAGILCHEYSIGMGPLIKQWKKGETNYSLRAIPIGGYVSMAGEDTNEELLKVGQEVKLNFTEVNRLSLFEEKRRALETDNSSVRVVSEIILDEKIDGEVRGTVVSYDLYSAEGDIMYLELENNGHVEKYMVKRDAFYVFNEKQKIQLAPYDRCFESKSLWKRFLTVFAGPMMNFVLALFIFLIVGLCAGVPNYESTKVGSVTTNYPASGILKEGDKLLAVDDVELGSWKEFTKYMDSLGAKESVKVKFERNGEVKEAEIKTFVISYRLGISNVGYTDYEGEGLKINYVFNNPDHYVAGKAGLLPGDIITGYYEGSKFVAVNDWQTLIDYIDKNPDLAEIELHYKRVSEDGKVTEGRVVSEMWTVDSLGPLGLPASFDMAIGVSCGTHFSFFGGIGNAFKSFWKSITTVFTTLGALFTNKQIGVKDLSGPVGIFTAVKTYLTTDAITFFSFVALISANIGLLNLLPIPALDGGRLVFLGYELVTRKKVNKKFETVLNNIVLILFMLLFVYVTFNDVLRLF